MHQQVEYTGCIEKFKGKTALMLPNGTVQFDDKSLEPFCYGWHNVGPRSDFKPITHVVYLFSAQWCEPCKSIKRIIEQEGLTDQVVVIDLGEDEPFFALHGVIAIPTLMYKDKRLIGLRPTQEVKDFINAQHFGEVSNATAS